MLDNTPEYWDPVWQSDKPSVHVLVTLNAQAGPCGKAVPQLAAATGEILGMAAGWNAAVPGALVLLEGHRGPSTQWQELSALMQGNQPIPFEHFGFMDALGAPIFSGRYPEGEEQGRAVGQGAVDGLGNRRPLAAGAFVLGWADEAQEVAAAAMPPDFSRIGSFISYRKLHQHDERFAQGSTQRDGALVEFRYEGDPQGTRCPMTTHMRGMNTRDSLDSRAAAEPKERMGSALNNRRRILRPGLPDLSRNAHDDEHGIVMRCHCASLSRQFEFVQQLWLNFGPDFNAGDDTCPLVGNHPDGVRLVADDRDGADRPDIKQGLAAAIWPHGWHAANKDAGAGVGRTICVDVRPEPVSSI